MPLPNAEWERFLDVTVRARTLAQRGSLAEGYRALQDGLADAERARADAEPWAEELSGLYRHALKQYAARYGAGLAG